MSARASSHRHILSRIRSSLRKLLLAEHSPFMIL